MVPAELRGKKGEGRERLDTARRREDERSGLDRRRPGGNRPAGKERRKPEPEAIQRHRLAKTALRQRSGRRDIPVAGLAGIAAIVSLAVGYGVYLGAPVTEPDPDCSAPPARGVNWRNCRLDGAVVETADLQGARLGNAQLRGARMPGTLFVEADLQYTDLSGSDLSHGEFVRARMKGAMLRNADLSYADLSHADLRFANLSDANLGGALLEGSRLDNAIWLDGKECGAGSVGECRR